MPTVIIPDKICSHCGGTKWVTRFRSGRTDYECKKSILEKQAKYRKNHPEQILLSAKKYRESNREKIKVYTKTYYDKNVNLISEKSKIRNQRPDVKIANLIRIQKYRKQERVQADMSQSQKKASSLLPDYIVKNRIAHAVGIPTSQLDITPKQIEQYRQHLKIHRLCQQVNKQTTI